MERAGEEGKQAQQEQSIAEKVSLINKIWKKEIFNTMSLELTGKVTKIIKDAIKTGKNAGKPFYKVNIEDVEGETLFFNAWAFEAIKDLQVGQMATVDYNLSPDGKYRHINQSVLVTDINQEAFPYGTTKNAIETPAPPREQFSSSKTEAKGSNNSYINRMSALKTAVEYHTGDEMDMEAVIETAKRFVEFIETGE